MKKLSTIFIFALISLGAFVFCGCKGCDDIESSDQFFTVNFIVDGELRDSILIGNEILDVAPQIAVNAGETINGWYTYPDYSNKWNFDNAVYSNLSLYAYTVSLYEMSATVTFIDDGKIVSESNIEKGNTVTEYIPDEKQGYIFKYWSYNENPFEFSTLIHRDITLTAVREPIAYSAQFYVDDILIDTREFTVEDSKINEPLCPVKQHYECYWEDYSLSCEDIKICAVYIPIVYTIDFIINDTLFYSSQYVITDSEFLAPELPNVKGFTGKWASYSVDGNCITVTANYSELNYTIYYLISATDDKKIYEKRLCTASTPVRDAPDVPQKVGYISEWETFTLDDNEIIFVEPVFTPITYYVRFFDGADQVACIPFDIENFEIENPTIPTVDGYTSRWEEYNLSLDDLDVVYFILP